ncbi:MAG: ACP S-malonyltransferase [Verrucomicrobia bacterium]|nr:ACP S-malonyltransferase [Verrucomicrobiota bacterium]
MASKLAVVFAGQGAQAVGMGRDLAEAHPECRDLFQRADEALGYGLSKICFEGPVEELTRSNHCQPAIFVASLACFHTLMREMPELQFAGTAGLSLGEWTALQIAGAITFEDALRALEARGRFMQEACEASEGGMVSVMGLAPERCADVAAEAGVEVANLNSREQTVLSGRKEDIVKAEALAKVAGAKKTVVLNVAGAFHSRLMQPAADRLAEFLAGVPLVTPKVTVLSNVTGEPHGNPDQMRRDLVRQVTGSVRWVGCIEWFAAQGIRGYVECGPGKVLSSLIKRIQVDARVANVQDVGSLEKTVAALKTAEWEA